MRVTLCVLEKVHGKQENLIENLIFHISKFPFSFSSDWYVLNN